MITLLRRAITVFVTLDLASILKIFMFLTKIFFELAHSLNKRATPFVNVEVDCYCKALFNKVNMDHPCFSMSAVNTFLGSKRPFWSTASGDLLSAAHIW
jgi:hypothetical protein